MPDEHSASAAFESPGLITRRPSINAKPETKFTMRSTLTSDCIQRHGLVEQLIPTARAFGKLEEFCLVRHMMQHPPINQNRGSSSQRKFFCYRRATPDPFPKLS